MASSKEYLELILGQLSELEEITYRTMMVEFAPFPMLKVPSNRLRDWRIGLYQHKR